jgi:hypothetical protein
MERRSCNGDFRAADGAPDTFRETGTNAGDLVRRDSVNPQAADGTAAHRERPRDVRVRITSAQAIERLAALMLS